MRNIKNKQGFILNHLSDEPASDSFEHSCENEESTLSPQEVAAKIWYQWMQCQSLSVQLKTQKYVTHDKGFEYKVSNNINSIIKDIFGICTK